MSPLRQANAPHPRSLSITNRQRDLSIDRTRLRAVMRWHLDAQLQLDRYDLALHLVSESRMARVNEAHLRHRGPTDVLTFDYAAGARDGLHGEVLVCPAVARVQARTYGTTWEKELIRYILHGLLHLRGFDDRTAPDRRRMKREEDRLLRGLLRVHPARRLRRSKAAT